MVVDVVDVMDVKQIRWRLGRSPDSSLSIIILHFDSSLQLATISWALEAVLSSAWPLQSDPQLLRTWALGAWGLIITERIHSLQESKCRR